MCTVFIIMFSPPSIMQDLFVERLSSAINKHEEQLALYNAQCDIQTQETKSIKEAVSEASLELEVCSRELFLTFVINCQWSLDCSA